MVLVVALSGCLQSFEERIDERVIEMRDHEIDAFAALDAVERGDLAAVRKAGKRLAKLDDVPGLPDHVKPMLDGVREEGANLGEVHAWEQVAVPMARLAERCGGCHELMKIEPKAPDRDLPLEEAFFAVAFREEARWRRAEAGLAAAGAEEASTWADRQQVLSVALRSLVHTHSGDADDAPSE